MPSVSAMVRSGPPYGCRLTADSRPVAEKLQAVMHFFGGSGGDELQDAAYLLADGIALLSGGNDTSVGTLLSDPSGVEPAKVAHVERINRSSLCGGELQW